MNSNLGLTTVEAKKRLLQLGPNEVVPHRLLSNIIELKVILFDPMGLMLLSLAFLHFLIGNKSDAWILLAVYFPVIFVDAFLELRAQRALRAMRATLATKSKVLREGVIQDIPTREIVLDDILVFEEGQSLPADGVVIEEANVSVNEASLTGESEPVDKKTGAFFFAGTTLLQGSGLGRVIGTGKNTEFGKIASLLEQTKEQRSPLQRKVHRIVRYVLIIALFLAVFLLGLEMYRGHSFIESLIIALTFGMSAVPEEFPLVFTLYLSLGAWRLSKHGVLIRSLPSVEALGNVDVICVDKTGTLTEGQFQLEELSSVQNSLPQEELWKSALMACEEYAVDAMEIAIKKKGEAFAPLLANWRLIHDYPFEPLGKYMSHVWEELPTKRTVISMKGAVEGVLEHCKLSALEKKNIIEIAESHAGQGQRILGLAAREGACYGQRDLDEQGLSFLGLFIFSDPVRASAREAISICQAAGIEIKMLTGDHSLTAHAVADKTGINHSQEAIFSGPDLLRLDINAREKAYQLGAIFSRVVPEQKFEMVRALQKAGKIVAMTGDGINDAPALKLADVGISMGLSATDVARSTAQMILVKNDFKGLVEAVFEGRRIFANLRRSFSYLISFHIPVILLALIPPLLNWGELLLPIHIIFLEMVVHPVSAYAFENLPGRHRESGKSLVPRKTLIQSIAAGVLLSLLVLILFRWTSITSNIHQARTNSIVAVLIGNIYFVLQGAEFTINKRLVWTLLLLALAAGGTPYLFELR